MTLDAQTINLHTGVSLNTDVALFAGAGVGAVVSLGGGVMIKTGARAYMDACMRANQSASFLPSLIILDAQTTQTNPLHTGVSQTSWTACQFVAFLGVAVFVGSGTVVRAGCCWFFVGSGVVRAGCCWWDCGGLLGFLFCTHTHGWLAGVAIVECASIHALSLSLTAHPPQPQPQPRDPQ